MLKEQKIDRISELNLNLLVLNKYLLTRILLNFLEIEFKIISSSTKVSEDALKQLKKLINEKYILRDEIKNESLTGKHFVEVKKRNSNLNISVYEILFYLLKLKSKLVSNDDIEIKFTNESIINLIGYKDEIVKAREQIKDYIIEIHKSINESYKKLMDSPIVNKNVQWEYYDGFKWRPFNLFVNHNIETAFILGTVTVFI